MARTKQTPKRQRKGTGVYKIPLQGLQAIRKEQKKTTPAISKAAIIRLVREISNDESIVLRSSYDTPLKWERLAINILHSAVEAYGIGLFDDANVAAIHGNRVTVQKKDLSLVLYLRGESSSYDTPVTHPYNRIRRAITQMGTEDPELPPDMPSTSTARTSADGNVSGKVLFVESSSSDEDPDYVSTSAKRKNKKTVSLRELYREGRLHNDSKSKKVKENKEKKSNGKKNGKGKKVEDDGNDKHAKSKKKGKEIESEEENDRTRKLKKKKEKKREEKNEEIEGSDDDVDGSKSRKDKKKKKGKKDRKERNDEVDAATQQITPNEDPIEYPATPPVTPNNEEVVVMQHVDGSDSRKDKKKKKGKKNRKEQNDEVDEVDAATQQITPNEDPIEYPATPPVTPNNEEVVVETDVGLQITVMSSEEVDYANSSGIGNEYFYEVSPGQYFSYSSGTKIVSEMEGSVMFSDDDEEDTLKEVIEMEVQNDENLSLVPEAEEADMSEVGENSISILQRLVDEVSEKKRQKEKQEKKKTEGSVMFSDDDEEEDTLNEVQDVISSLQEE